MNKKEEQYLRRKGQILEIALDHFIKYGYYGTSTRKIAEDAKISSGLMFHYFQDKKAIYDELVRIGCEKMVTDTKDVEDPLKFFEDQVDWLFEILKINDFSARMFIFMGMASVNSESISADAYEMLSKNDAETLSIPVIKKGQKAGVIRQGDPLSLAVIFYGGLQQFAINTAVRKDLKLPPKESFLACLKEG